MNEKGQIVMKLMGVDTPDVVTTGSVDICCMCGSITIAGIYQMLDPTKVYFLEKNEESKLNFEFDFSIFDEE